LKNYAGRFDALSSEGRDAHSPASVHVDSISHPHAPADAIIVPDAHLLFHGDFKRSGVDLILSGDDREIVLHDYFKAEKRAALASPDGAHLTGDIVNALTGSVEVSQAAGTVSVAKVIGHVSKLAGTATAIRNGVSIILHQGDNVEKGDVVQSGSDSTLGITFIDGTVFGLSSNARMVLNEMVYDPNGSNNSSLLSLVAGTISFVAGETAKHGDMKIDTPVATMGIRGTAVLVEIDFTVPGQGGTPDAKFQVLVEPDGTTGSYILFDKTTLQPLAMVNQAGQQINISQGVITQSNAPLSPDVQKLIEQVFTLKFTDNTNPNPKTNTGQNDSVTPQTGPVIKTASGDTATPIVLIVDANTSHLLDNPSGPIVGPFHIPGPPTAVMLDLTGNVTTSFSITELAGKTGDASDPDHIGGKVNFVDINAGDTPTVRVNFSAFAYQNAQHQDVTAKLSLLQLADIAKTEVNINVVPDPHNNNTGSANFTYSVPDNAFDFLAAGETLTLTYVARVDNNFAGNNETTLVPFTITVTGTNDAPVITSGPQKIAFSGGTNVSGGSLPLSSNDPTHGTLTFSDVDLTDTHTVKVELTNPPASIPPAPLAFFEQALSAAIATDSTGTGTGTVNWKLADIPVYDADFIPAGQTLTLTYTVTVTDEHNASSTQTITVTIQGTAPAAEVWIATTTGENPGGLWRDGANWETGLAPTASDDVIIITDQLQHLTPSYPVTIDTQAVAHSVTMNDFSNDYPGSAPKLIVASIDGEGAPNSLTIGGDFNLSVDAEVDNYGTISVGGLMEVAGSSIVKNYGLLTLKQGGDFTDNATITNSGTIDVNGKTLNVSVDIGNSGSIQVDEGATLVLKAGAITGGTATINGTLELDGTSFLNTGTLNNYGAVNVKGTDAFDAETVKNSGAMEIFAGAVLLLDLGTTIDNTHGSITIDAASAAPALGAAILTLNGATLTGGTLSNGGTIDSTGTSAIHDANITNTGLIEATSGTLSIDPAVSVSITNSGTLEANGGELDITSEPVINTGTLQAINHGTLKLTSTNVTNSDGGSVSIEAGSTLDLVDLASTGIKGGTLINSGALDNVSGVNLISAAVTNTGTIEVESGTLDLAGGLTGAGKVIIDAGATLELAGADGQTITFAGDGATLRLDSTALQYTGTIAGVSFVSGNFTITGPGNITSASGDALDFTASGGTADGLANVTLTPSGTITGAVNGILVVQNGTGDLTVDPSGNVTGLAGNGIVVEESATGFGNIVVDDSGSATGTGTGSVGLLVENLNAANPGNITITQLGGASGDSYGIDALTDGNGNVTLESDGAVSAAVQYGIRVRSFGTGSESVTTDDKSVVNSGGSGIVAGNRDTSIDASANSTITVTAHGTINSGTDLNLSDTAPAGILAGYNGIGGFGSQANTDVNGTVTINNDANITAAAGYGIEAYDYGNGNVTVNDEAGTKVSGAQYGIAAYQLSGGTGDVTIDVAEHAAITGTSIYGIQAFSDGTGGISVTTSSKDVVDSGSSGIVAVNEATSISGDASSTISVTANGTIHSGTNLNNNGSTPAGIDTGYFPAATASPDGDVAGNVIVHSNAVIIADAGYGIDAYNYGTGDVTVTTSASSSITAAGTAIGAFANDGGNVSVTNDGVATGATGLSAFANHAGNITIVNDGSLTGTSFAGIHVTQDDPGATGSTHITNDGTGTLLGSASSAAISVAENATGTFTLDNAGTIGPASIMSSTEAIFESGGDFGINNTGTINGTLNLANGTFHNENGGTWNVAGASGFGFTSSTDASEANTIDNAGTIHLSGSASLSGAGLTITDSGTIDNLSGDDSIHGAATTITNSGLFEVTGGTLTIDAASSLANTGTGTLEANGGTLIIDGTLSGNAEIVGASLIELGASDPAVTYSSATITFAAGSAGTLKLDHAETFKGTVAGLDDNTLDLGDIKSGANTTVTYDSVHDTLTIASNTDPTQVAQIQLTGDYSGAHWIVGSDLNGGTTVTEAPGAISGLDSHGNALEGVTVTASITDGGQAVTGATYQWQLDGENIQDATSASYTPTESDEGHALTVEVGFIDAQQHSETSEASAGTVQESPTENAAIALSGLVDGSPVEHHQVTAIVTDPDAPSSGITYTWMVGGQTVKTGMDADGNSYTPTEADEGKALSVSVSFTDPHNFKESGAATAGIVTDGDDDQSLAHFLHLSPAIDTTHFSVAQSPDGATTITGLQVTDLDPFVSSKTFTVSAVAQSGAILSPTSGSGSLAHINADFTNGVTYDPGSNPPQTDKITLTVADAFGETDTVHFVFNEAGTPPSPGSPIVLTGTSGKDVIFGTGYGDVLTGGGGADQFVFTPTSGPTPAQHTITDFNVALDKIDLRQFSHIDSWRDVAATQQGSGTLLTLDNHDTVLLQNVKLSSLHGSDFIVSPHGSS
jgi:hypothetical protein